MFLGWPAHALSCTLVSVMVFAKRRLGVSAIGANRTTGVNPLVANLRNPY
jgi:hypothetical protein